MDDNRPLDWSYDAANLPAGGVEFTTAADADECAAVAAFLSIPSVETLRVAWTIRPWRKSGVRVTGALSADVTQACGVTLDPVGEEVVEEINVRLSAEPLGGARRGSERELEIDPHEEDPPETFDGRHVDLAGITLEHLALGLTPYPRKPGVAFEGFETGAPAEPLQDDSGEREDSPFSVLAGLASGKRDD